MKFEEIIFLLTFSEDIVGLEKICSEVEEQKRV